MNVIKKSRQLGNTVAACATVVSLSPFAFGGGSDVWFTPLTESAPVSAPNSFDELAYPWVSPAGILQFNLLSLREVEDAVLSPDQSIIRVPDEALLVVGRADQGSMIDMLAFDNTGEFIFLPHETPVGAGVTRFDLLTRTSEVLFQGDLEGVNGNWTNDYGAFDPCRFTPNETLILGEEWAGEGRIIEVLDPFGVAPLPANQIRELNSIPNVAHEGINFSEQYKKVIYFIDEWNSGSIYKFVMKRPGDYTEGRSFVLSVDDFIPSGGVAEDNWNEQADGVVRTGMATWIPLTDKWGFPLAGITNPFRNGPSNDPRTNDNTLGGRPAADDVGGTPYGRPEDMEVGKLKNGNEVLYIAVTSERTIYSVEILKGNKAKVGILVDDANFPKNLGYAPTTGEMNSPDNLAQDAVGNIYIIEDAPNGSLTGGDIWMARDVNNDGVAESLDHFLSITVAGSEATGMIFNPQKPTEFVVAVQHPTSTDLSAVPDGLGDAVWQFDIANIPNKRFVKELERAHSKSGRVGGPGGKH